MGLIKKCFINKRNTMHFLNCCIHHGFMDARHTSVGTKIDVRMFIFIFPIYFNDVFHKNI